MFLNDWRNADAETVLREFEASYWNNYRENDSSALLEEYRDIEILLASYVYANYNGDAFVLFQKDGVLYEVNGSHCSCYGLENQWSPEETSIVELRHRLDKGHLGNASYNPFATELRQVLNSLEGQHAS
jgi:hypothetical protein